jgi:uncharacterized protein (DUF885 family)
MRRALPLLLLASCGFLEPSIEPAGLMPETREADAENGRFDSLIEAFLGWWWSTHPTRATTDGIHDHDTRLDDVSPDGLAARRAGAADFLRRVEQVRAPLLTDERYYDWLVLRSHLQAVLHDLDAVRPWERNPNFYREIITGGLYSLAKLSFAKPDVRMRLAAERLAQVPAVLAAGKANLKDCPKVHVEVALDEFLGAHRFLRETLPAAFKEAGDADLRKRFEERQKAALAAVEDFAKWMRLELLPKAVDAFAIGEDAYRKKLLYEEMVDTPIEDLLKRGLELLKWTQDQFAQTARSIDAKRDPREILRETAKDHPAADRLLDEVRAMLDGLKTFAQRSICDVPADAACLVQETPEFRRSMSFASMEIPGPFEAVAKEAYYSVTLPDPSWPPERAAQHLSFFNKYTLPLISVHEAYPGHYVQFLVVRKSPSKVRKVLGCASFSEGWAHYLEQHYVDLQARQVPALRLHQLHMALLRICRYLAGIRMHCRGMTREQAVELFMNEGYQERANAEREALRGTSDPTVLVYTLGKHQILDLWSEVKGRMPKREFHNRLISMGYPPIKVARMALLGVRE